ncbi:MAG: glycosyltransferase [Methanomassiliicoccaceae archaeon]|jgi:1,2-diacylglycerol 3-alpha-glucosyltransferase|nr:glycosyltransferase [Methanomassiliicoccaceae archaeon]
MRIAMITDSYYPTRDGVVTSITLAKEGLEKLGHDVTVVAPDPGKEKRMEGVRYFPSIQFKSYQGYYVPVYPSNKAEIIRSIDPDVIHIHGIAVMALKGLIAAKNQKIPTVLTYHTMVEDTIDFYSPLKVFPNVQKRMAWVYMRGLLKRPDVIIGPSEDTIDKLLVKGIRPKRTEVIPTGIDTERFRPGMNGDAVKEKYGLNGSKVILYVGRLSFEKNIGVIINALSHLNGVKLLIVGKGPAKESLEETAKNAKVEDKVIFAGFVPDEELQSFYGAADVFVSASRFETQGLSVLEALSCGLPVACADGGAFINYIKNGENGFLFGEGAEECANAIRSCISCDQKIKENARATAESMSAASCAEKLVKLYEELTKKK